MDSGFITSLQHGKYRIDRFISSGGFGCTYEAEHVMLKKKVAIKEFFVKDFCNRDSTTGVISVGTQSKVALVGRLKEKFFEEAIALSQMQHPNIVQVTDVFEENGTAYYVMNYIDGISLNELIKSKNKLSEAEAIAIVQKVADALDYVHTNNRLHLDIKPANIMIDKEGNVILIDFGVSKQYDSINGENTSSLLGKTPGYAPIEQMGNSIQQFTPATDIYALGATLYKMLSGTTPPESTRITEDGLPELPASISEKTRSAVYKAMEIRKKDRPQSIKEFISMLSCNTQAQKNCFFDKANQKTVNEDTKPDTIADETKLDSTRKNHNINDTPATGKIECPAHNTVTKEFDCTPEKLHEKLVNVLKTLNCIIEKDSNDTILFISNASGMEWFRMNGNWRYCITIQEHGPQKTICKIEAKDPMEGVKACMEWLDKIILGSRVYSKKIINML